MVTQAKIFYLYEAPPTVWKALIRKLRSGCKLQRWDFGGKDADSKAIDQWLRDQGATDEDYVIIDIGTF